MSKIKILSLICIFLFSNVAISQQGCSLYGENINWKSSDLEIVPFPGNENFKNHFIDKAFLYSSIFEFTGLNQPFVAIINDFNKPNAFATSRSIIRRHHDSLVEIYTPENTLDHANGYAVFFGSNMLWKLAYPTEGDDLRTAEIGAVLAHEFAHILQFQAINNADPADYFEIEKLRKALTPNKELMADMVAGWAMYKYGRKYSYNTPSTDMRNDLIRVLNRMYSLGDFEFNSSTHHGTPSQRLEAFKKGYDLSRSNQGSDVRFIFVKAYNEYIYRIDNL